MSDRIADIRRRVDAALQARGQRYERAATAYYDLAYHAPADIRYLLEQIALRDAALDGARELQRQLSEEVKRLTAESEGRRRTLEAVGEDRRLEWIRAERAEAEVERLKAELEARKAEW